MINEVEELPLMTFDWNKAARLLQSKKTTYAVAGFWDTNTDMGYPIWLDGEPATNGMEFKLTCRYRKPSININGKWIECWILTADNPYPTDAYWPAEAVKIVKSPKKSNSTSMTGC